MKNLDYLNTYRVAHPFAGMGDSGNGCFLMYCPDTGTKLKIIASSGDGWEHVSVSCEKRTPNWKEMTFVRDRFFQDDEWVMQLHAPKDKHIDIAVNCLHMWRPTDQPIPTPPPEYV